MSHFTFSILAFSTDFCPYEMDMSGTTVSLQASAFLKLAKLDFFSEFQTPCFTKNWSFTFQDNILENLNFNGNFSRGNLMKEELSFDSFPPFFSGLTKDKKLLCGRLNVKGRIFTLICWIWNWSFSKSRSHFLQLVKGMTDRQTLSATFRNSTLESIVTFQSWVKLKTRCVLN